MTSQNINYRVWTNIKETKLIEALINMVNIGGFKVDNGFKSGYLAHIGQMLKESLPDSGILGKPHIESKIKVMKKDWQVVHDMLHGSNTSGFGYDSVNQCVNAGDQVWESYLQSHKRAAKWRNKPFPHYRDLCIVFGKDRAQGSNARDALEMQEEANMEEQAQYFLDDETSSHIPHSNANVQNEETSSARTKTRKARVDVVVEGFKDAVTYLGDSLEKISKKSIGASNKKKNSITNVP